MSKKPIPKPRDVPWILQRLRAFLLGREHNTTHKWAKYMAPRTQPQPKLPLGSSSRIRFNYYCDRDGRREVNRPKVLYDSEIHGQKLVRAIEAKYAGCRPLEVGEEEKGSKEMVEEEEMMADREGDKKEKVITKKEGEKEASKTAGEKKLKGTSDKDEGQGNKETSIGKKEEKKDTIKKAEEEDGNETAGTVLGKEEETGNTLKRVPGKIWHWDRIIRRRNNN